MRQNPVLLRTIAALAVAAVLAGTYVYCASEWMLRRHYDAPLVALHAGPADLAAGQHLARVIGCWNGCHGGAGEGGDESLEGLRTVIAPTLTHVVPQYTDEELVRLIRYGVKRDGTSAIGMIAPTFWPLGDQDLANLIAHLRAQPPLPPIRRYRKITFRGRVGLLRGEWKLSADAVDRSIPRWGELPLNTSFERGRYLASITCSECHGLDFRGYALEGGPSLVILAAYSPEQFRTLLKTGKPLDGRSIPKMSWMPAAEFSDPEIADLYRFLREYHGLPAAGASP